MGAAFSPFVRLTLGAMKVALRRPLINHFVQAVARCCEGTRGATGLVVAHLLFRPPCRTEGRASFPQSCFRQEDPNRRKCFVAQCLYNPEALP